MLSTPNLDKMTAFSLKTVSDACDLYKLKSRNIKYRTNNGCTLVGPDLVYPDIHFIQRWKVILWTLWMLPWNVPKWFNMSTGYLVCFLGRFKIEINNGIYSWFFWSHHRSFSWIGKYKEMTELFKKLTKNSSSIWNYWGILLAQSLCCKIRKLCLMIRKLCAFLCILWSQQPSGLAVTTTETRHLSA